MDINNAYERAVLESMPIEMFPGYVPHVEPVPLHGPDYSQWTLNELLHAGLLCFKYKGTPFLEILNNWHESSDMNPENTGLLLLVISWYKIADNTLADYRLFPKFPFNLKHIT